MTRFGRLQAAFVATAVAAAIVCVCVASGCAAPGGDLAGIKTKVDANTAEIAVVKATFDAEIVGVKGDVDAEIVGVKGDIAALKTENNPETRQTGWVNIAWLTGGGTVGTGVVVLALWLRFNGRRQDSTDRLNGKRIDRDERVMMRTLNIADPAGRITPASGVPP